MIQQARGKMIRIDPKDKPKFFELRRRLAKLFVDIARRIYPVSPEVNAFYIQMMTDQMVLGQCMTRIDPSLYYMTKDGLKEYNGE